MKVVKLSSYQVFMAVVLLTTACRLTAQTATPAWISLKDYCGNPADRHVTITSLDGAINFGDGALTYSDSVEFDTHGGVGMTNLVMGNYRVRFEGLPKSLQIFWPADPGITNIADARVLSTNVVPIAAPPVHWASLDASNIVSGTLVRARIPALTTNEFDPAVTALILRSSSLDASNVVSGTLAVDRIPDLDASKITSGLFSESLIPPLSSSKIPSVLADNDGMSSVGLDTRSLNDFLGNPSVIYGWRNLLDVPGNLSMDWGRRMTLSVGGQTNIVWAEDVPHFPQGLTGPINATNVVGAVAEAEHAAAADHAIMADVAIDVDQTTIGSPTIQTRYGVLGDSGGATSFDWGSRQFFSTNRNLNLDVSSDVPEFPQGLTMGEARVTVDGDVTGRIVRGDSGRFDTGLTVGDQSSGFGSSYFGIDAAGNAYWNDWQGVTHAYIHSDGSAQFSTIMASVITNSGHYVMIDANGVGVDAAPYAGYAEIVGGKVYATTYHSSGNGQNVFYKTKINGHSTFNSGDPLLLVSPATGQTVDAFQVLTTNGAKAFGVGVDGSTTMGYASGSTFAASALAASPLFRGPGNASFVVGSTTTPMVSYIATNHNFTGSASVSNALKVGSGLVSGAPANSTPASGLSVKQSAASITNGVLLEASDSTRIGGFYHNGTGLVLRENGVDALIAEAGTVKIPVTLNLTNATTTGTELVMSQSGDSLGASKLRLQNRPGSGGAVLENAAIGMTDFKFQNTSNAANIRFESRKANLINMANTNGEFQLVNPANYIPWFGSGENGTAIKTPLAFTSIANYQGPICTNGVASMWNSNGVVILRYSAVGSTTWAEKQIAP
jgi:hypothetical protein